MKTAYLLPLVFLLSNSAFAAYKWVDAEGNVQYTQTPPPGMNSSKVTPPPASSIPAPEAKKPAAEKKTDPAAAAPAANPEEEEKIAAIRKANCEKAKSHMQALGVGAPMLIPDPQNPEKFVIMTDELRKQKTAETQAHIDNFCNNKPPADK
ncbi:MAG: DUF4124 domain-containing protein [Thiotrichaceae bacterium]|nr:DUF4124 domain-containing protein [Thiotrichaceae bacterium]